MSRIWQRESAQGQLDIESDLIVSAPRVRTRPVGLPERNHTHQVHIELFRVFHSS